MLNIPPHISIPDEEFEFSFVRSSGPGGQNVNKVNSKAVLRWRIVTSPSLPQGVLGRFRLRYPSRITKDGEILVMSDKYRDQGRNAEDCLAKLREMLAAVAVAPKTRRKTKPSKASKERRFQAKQHAARKKEGRRGPRGDD